jgi:peptide deformylase
MSFDLPATPVEIVKVGHPALRNGTRIVPQELFGAPALHELIEVSSFSRGRRLPRAG